MWGFILRSTCYNVVYLNSVTWLSSIHQLVMHQQAHCVWCPSFRDLIRCLLKPHNLFISKPEIGSRSSWSLISQWLRQYSNRLPSSWKPFVEEVFESIYPNKVCVSLSLQTFVCFDLIDSTRIWFEVFPNHWPDTSFLKLEWRLSNVDSIQPLLKFKQGFELHLQLGYSHLQLMNFHLLDRCPLKLVIQIKVYDSMLT